VQTGGRLEALGKRSRNAERMPSTHAIANRADRSGPDNFIRVHKIKQEGNVVGDHLIANWNAERQIALRLQWDGLSDQMVADDVAFCLIL